MATTFTGGLKSILNSANTLRADIHVNNMEIDGDLQIDGDLDVKGEICINDGVGDLVCLSSTSLEKKSPDENFEIKNSTSSDLILNAADAAGDLKLQVNSLDVVALNNTTCQIDAATDIKLQIASSDVVTLDSSNCQIDAGSDIKLQIGSSDALTLNSTSCQIENKTIIDVSDSEGFLVRKQADSGDILTVDTSTDRTIFGGNGIQLPTAGASASDLNFHAISTHNTNWSGPFAVPVAGNIAFERTGDTVRLNIPAFSAAASFASKKIRADTILPTYLRPSFDQYQQFVSLDNSVRVAGSITIRADGNMVISANLANGADGTSGDYTAAGNAGTDEYQTVTFVNF